MGQFLSKRPKRSKCAQDNGAYLAKPSGKCCLEGTIHKGEARGSWDVIAGVDTYISKPPEGKANGHVLLYFPDVWGMFPNGLLVMDAFADAGFLTLGLDYFRGVSLSLIAHLDVFFFFAEILQDPVWKHRKDRHDTQNKDFDYEAWKKKHTAFADEAVPQWVKAVTERYKNSDETKFFCVGYCFGAPYVCNELAGGTVTAGAFAHPAFLKEHHFQNIKSEWILHEVSTEICTNAEHCRAPVSVLLRGRPHV